MKTWLGVAILVFASAVVEPGWAMQSRIGRDQAAAIAQRVTGGRVLSVDRATIDGHEVFRVKVLTPNGEVRIILLDAETGSPK